jgi:acetyltransferase-like isoleucine patch superfamily enzyme
MSLHGIHRRMRRYAATVRAHYWRLLHPGLDIGPSVRIGRDCRLILDSHARLVLGAHCEVDDATTIAVYDHGRVDFGPGAFIGHHCTVAARAAIEIGAGTHLAELVSVRDHDHVVGAPPSSGEMTVDPVVIGPNVWIGAKATVLRGARIGEGAVIGANAVVRGELPARSVCAGVPARVIRLLDPVGDAASEHLA